jgi:hypothetical protein
LIEPQERFYCVDDRQQVGDPAHSMKGIGAAKPKSALSPA